MKLAEELGFKRDFQDLSHEALLNVFYATSLAKKRSAEFFHDYGITDVQFNLMMLLRYQGGEGGLSHVELSHMMLVNRANITAIIDRMEKAGLVARSRVPEDRRSKAVKLTGQGAGLLDDVEHKYRSEIARIMGTLEKGELKQLVSMLERVRANIRDLDRPAQKSAI